MNLNNILVCFSAVCRKNEITLYPFYKKKGGSGSGGGGVPLTRKPSFNSMRPFLHQYEVKGQSGPNSAPSSPVKSKESGFKRSLSFGAGARKKPNQQKVTPHNLPPLSMPTATAVKDHTPLVTCATPPAPKTTPTTVVPAAGKCVVARQCKHGAKRISMRILIIISLQ